MIQLMQYATFHKLEQYSANNVVTMARLIAQMVKESPERPMEEIKSEIVEQIQDQTIKEQGPLADPVVLSQSAPLIDIAEQYYLFLTKYRPEVYEDITGETTCNCRRCRAKREAQAAQ